MKTKVALVSNMLIGGVFLPLTIDFSQVVLYAPLQAFGQIYVKITSLGRWMQILFDELKLLEHKINSLILSLSNLQ